MNESCQFIRFHHLLRFSGQDGAVLRFGHICYKLLQRIFFYRKIDIEQDSSAPKAFNLSNEELLYFKKSFSNLPEPQQRELCRDLLLKQLNKLDSIKTAELKAYVGIYPVGTVPELSGY